MKLKLRFTQKEGVQNPLNLLGEPTDVLGSSSGGPLVQTGLAGSDTLAFPAPVAVVA